MSLVFLGSQGNPSPGVLLPPDGPWPLLELALRQQLQLSQLQGHQGETVVGETVVGAGGTALSSTLGLGL